MSACGVWELKGKVWDLSSHQLPLNLTPDCGSGIFWVRTTGSNASFPRRQIRYNRSDMDLCPVPLSSARPPMYERLYTRPGRPAGLLRPRSTGISRAIVSQRCGTLMSGNCLCETINQPDTCPIRVQRNSYETMLLHRFYNIFRRHCHIPITTYASTD